MPDQSVPERVAVLAGVYRSAQESLIRLIATKEARGSVATYQKRILAQVERKLRELDRYAAEWVNSAVPVFYSAGWDSVHDALKRAGLAGVKPPIDDRAVRILIDNTYMDLFEAHRYVGRAVNDMVRRAGLEAVTQKVVTGGTVKDAKDALIRSLTDRGITAIRDKRGREIRLDAYAEMVARTTTREATNQATIDQLQDLGYDLVRMSSHATACAVCIPLEGRVYSISGLDKRFPALSVAMPPPYMTVHPNCLHVLEPYIERLDDNVPETIRQSNRAFELSADEQKRVDAYKRHQDARRRMRQDRLQWERYRTVLPHDTPKTFSGFRRSKRSGSALWQRLESAYRAARQ